MWVAVASRSICRSAHQQTRRYGNANSGTSNPTRHDSSAGITRWPVAWTGPIRQAHDHSDALVTVNGSQPPREVRTRPVDPVSIRGGWASTSSTLGPHSGHRRVSTSRSQTRSGGAAMCRQITSRNPSGVFSIASVDRSRSSWLVDSLSTSDYSAQWTKGSCPLLLRSVYFSFGSSDSVVESMSRRKRIVPFSNNFGGFASLLREISRAEERVAIQHGRIRLAQIIADNIRTGSI